MIFRAVLPDGTLKYILGIGHPVFNASGDAVEFVGAAMDITERKRAEVVGQRLAAIVDSSEDAIGSKDLSGTIESWNGGGRHAPSRTRERDNRHAPQRRSPPRPR